MYRATLNARIEVYHRSAFMIMGEGFDRETMSGKLLIKGILVRSKGVRYLKSLTTTQNLARCETSGRDKPWKAHHVWAYKG